MERDIDGGIAVRCGGCRKVIGIRRDNMLSIRMRKREIRIELIKGQNIFIVCDRCGHENIETGK